MMQDELTLPHSRFHFQITTGTVSSSKQWTETNVTGGGMNDKPIRTETKNHMEFWLELDNGKERPYNVDANKVSIREGNQLRVLDLVYNKGKKAGQYKAIMVFNDAQDMLYTCEKPMSLFFDEKPIISTVLLLAMIFGFIGWWSPTVAFVHFLVLLFGIPYFLYKRGQYKKILRRIAKKCFDVSI